MVSEFAEFARLPLPVRQPVELEDLVDRVVDLYGSEPEVEIHTEVAPGLKPVDLDPDQISRALKNVLGNAIEAARERPATAEGAPEVTIRVAVDEELIEIEITDNGPGLSAEAERRLFEPYYTTKAHGTGLGMALTYRIVVEHGGVIFAENSSGGGARVVVRLPLVAPEPRQLAAQREEAMG
jgi:signal transduction histidine kinase